MGSDQSSSGQYRKDSLSLVGAVSMGTGVMIGAGIFALTGQMAEQSGNWFPLAFVSAAIVTAFSAYTYTKFSNAHPSAGGIAMYLKQAYGKGTITAGCAMLMYFSMVINESLVARTFGTYTLQLFDTGKESWLVPVLGVSLLLFAFIVNLLGNEVIGRLSMITAVIKVGGIAIVAIIGLSLAGFSFESLGGGESSDVGGFLAATALGILAYKGFTTITNSGGELKDPKKNVSRAIIISIGVCVVVYLLVALAVAGNLSLKDIIRAKDYVLAEAARPALGEHGVRVTVGIAIVATVSGVIASAFAVSRMLAMLTDMGLVPHRHFRMPGNVQQHTLVYTIVLAILLTVFFDLSRIASLGAIFYLVMDVAIHWGAYRHVREDIQANGYILLTAIALDLLVLGAFVALKAASDPLVLVAAGVGIGLIFGGEKWFLKWKSNNSSSDQSSE